MTIATTTLPKRVTKAQLEAVVVNQAHQVRQLSEDIGTLQLAIEDRGWSRGGNQHEATGLDLHSIKIISKDLRAWIVAGGIIKRIIELRGNTIYGDGVGFKGIAKAKTPFNSTNNVAKLFSADALMQINRSHGSDGSVVFLVEKDTKDIVRYAVHEMGAPYLDPNDSERVWFVRRHYTQYDIETGIGKEIDEFIATDMLPSSEANVSKIMPPSTLTSASTSAAIPVNKNYTAVVWDVNKQVGWPLGIPDLLPSLQWAEKYTDYLKDQGKFAKALAQIAWQYRAQNTDQAKKIAAAITPDGVADSIIQTPGMDVKPLPGNTGVSFDNGQALAAQAAAAGEVTVDDLLAKTQVAAAGASIDPQVANMATARRLSATTFFQRIGKLLGAPNLQVIWPDLQSESPFREAQMIVNAWSTGLYSPDEVRAPLSSRLRLDIDETAKAPKGILIPNNSESIAKGETTTTTDSDGNTVTVQKVGGPPAAGKAPAGKVGNKQGQSTGVGKLSDGDNTTRDKGENPA